MISVECSEGWGTDGKGGCEMCDHGWYKPTQANDNCTQCGMAGIVRKSTKERGSVNKASCISELHVPRRLDKKRSVFDDR